MAVTGTEVHDLIKELYSKHGHNDLKMEVSSPDLTFAQKHHDPIQAQVQVSQDGKKVSIMLNSENPELLEIFFVLLDSLQTEMEKKGFQKDPSSTFYGDWYILEMSMK